MVRTQHPSRLNPRKRYLQVALNSTLEEARDIIFHLPISDRIIIEAGTPLIKRYGTEGVRQIRDWYQQRLSGGVFLATRSVPPNSLLSSLIGKFGAGLLTSMLSSSPTWNKRGTTPPAAKPGHAAQDEPFAPYVVADLKTMDRGETEVAMVAEAGASAAIALGSAPIETLNVFIAACDAHGLDAMLDMMNVEYPLGILRKLKKVPPVIILHRGVDEERDNREKMLPLHEIRRIKGNYDVMISIAGGDTTRDVQRAVFNDADIVVIWKSVYHRTADTVALIDGFLKDIR